MKRTVADAPTWLYALPENVHVWPHSWPWATVVNVSVVCRASGSGAAAPQSRHVMAATVVRAAALTVSVLHCCWARARSASHGAVLKRASAHAHCRHHLTATFDPCNNAFNKDDMQESSSCNWPHRDGGHWPNLGALLICGPHLVLVHSCMAGAGHDVWVGQHEAGDQGSRWSGVGRAARGRMGQAS